MAVEAISRLLTRDMTGTGLVKDVYLDRLVKVACAPDGKAMTDLLADMRRAVVLPDRIAEDYIPAALRKLGQDWEDDCRSFSDVTLGSARLAGLLRLVSNTSIDDDIGNRAQSALLIIVPSGEQHTMGSTVLASQLRRLGHSVCLRIAPSLTDLAALIGTHHFNGIMISVGNRTLVETVTMLVKTLRAMTKGNVPIVVGGALMDREPAALAQTEADLATGDVEQALAFLGLGVPGRGHGGGKHETYGG